MYMYSPYNKEEGTFFEANCGHKIEVVWSISCCKRGLIVMSVQLLFGTFFEVLSIKGGSYNIIDLAWISKQKGVGLLGVVSGFPLLEIVILLLIYFPEANKISLSLSLSLWVSPHWSFPWLVA
jgi:hypothetical protein